MANKPLTRYLLPAIVAATALGTISEMPVLAQDSVGNPRPGYPHDTIIIHVKKMTDAPVQGEGGHSLFLREDNGDVLDASIFVTMIDWNQIDNDNDGSYDEDPKDGLDNDGDLLTDEDWVELGADTKAIDCDAWGDSKITLQIRDTDPRPGFVSTQEWFIRAIGKPGENMAFTTYANQVVMCDEVVNADGTSEVVCYYGEQGDWIQIAEFNLASMDAVKQVKGTKAGGKTPFANITEGFLVDVQVNEDVDGNGIIDQNDVLSQQFIFSISCFDNPDTLLDETLYCPLSNLIWDIDDEITTSKAKAQVFVSHTGTANVRTGKIVNSQN